MKTPEARVCLLKSLSDPRLGGALPGLRLATAQANVALDSPFELDPAAFPCCGATGRRLLPDVEVTTLCDLGKRLGSLRRLARQLELTHGAEGRTIALELQASPAEAVHATLQRLHALELGTTARGLALTRDPKSPRRPSLWALAFAAAWRYGLEPHVVSLEKTPQAALLPAQAPGASVGRRTVIFVENVHKLWDAHVADQFELILSFAYNAMAPIFVELVMEPQGEGRGDTKAMSTKLALTRRIDRIKSRSPLAWLRPDALSKLAAACDGVTPPPRAESLPAPRARAPRPTAEPSGRWPSERKKQEER